MYYTLTNVSIDKDIKTSCLKKIHILSLAPSSVVDHFHMRRATTEYLTP